MAKKYVLKSTVGINHGPPNEVPIEDFDEKDYLKFEEGTLRKQKFNELMTMAIEQEGFEWWIEEGDSSSTIQSLSFWSA